MKARGRPVPRKHLAAPPLPPSRAWPHLRQVEGSAAARPASRHRQARLRTKTEDPLPNRRATSQEIKVRANAGPRFRRFPAFPEVCTRPVFTCPATSSPRQNHPWRSIPTMLFSFCELSSLKPKCGYETLTNSLALPLESLPEHFRFAILQRSGSTLPDDLSLVSVDLEAPEG